MAFYMAYFRGNFGISSDILAILLFEFGTKARLALNFLADGVGNVITDC